MVDRTEPKQGSPYFSPVLGRQHPHVKPGVLFPPGSCEGRKIASRSCARFWGAIKPRYPGTVAPGMWLPRASKLSSEDVTIFEYIKPEVFFPRMRSKGSRFTLGGLGGVEAVFAKRCATVRNCSQSFATLRGRPCEARMAVPMASSAKGVTFGGFQRRVASFRVASVALCDISTCFITCQKWFSVEGAIFLRRFQKMGCSFRGRRSILATYIVILRGRRSTSDVPLHTLHFTLHILQFTLHTLHFTLHTLHSTHDTPHFTLYTPHFTLYSPHFTLHTLHFTLHTPHFTVHTLHSTLYTLHSTLYTPHFTLYTPHSTLYSPHFTLHTPHFTVHTWHSTLYTLHLHTPHFTLYTPHSKLYTRPSHFTLYTPHFTLYTPHFTVHTLHSTLHTLQSTLYTPHSTLYTPHSTLYTLHSTL